MRFVLKLLDVVAGSTLFVGALLFDWGWLPMIAYVTAALIASLQVTYSEYETLGELKKHLVKKINADAP